MIIYKAEESVEGLAEKVLANQSVAYSTEIQVWTPSEREEVQRQHLASSLKTAAKEHGLALGSAFDNDLFFTKSILVSTNWNKNDDVFTPENVWAARHTPSHKPTNLEHDETRQVGHITETWALDVDGNVIPDNTVVDDLPDLFHIANGAVIYTNWQNDDLVARTNELIGKIQAGQKFVSMEAIFTGFDYALISPEESYNVVARTKDTAFLTKHLRVYGGQGVYDGFKVGRLLKNITFSGKGYVDKPANPYSVIFGDGNIFNHSTASTENPFVRQSGVLFSCSSNSLNPMEKSSMSDSVEFLKTQAAEQKDTITKLEAKINELVQAQTEAGIAAIKADAETLKNTLEATEKERDEALASVETLTSDKTDLSDQLAKATEAKEALDKELSEAKEAQTKADRIASLVDGGVDKEVATTKVEVFANLTDEQFEVVAADIVAAAFPPKKDDEKDDKKDKSKSSDESSDDISKDDAEANADESVVDNAEASDDEVDLTVEASDDDNEEADKAEATRASIAMFLSARKGHQVEETETE